MLRVGIVVATHPEDHSVDIVMADTGARLVGVQVATPNGSTRSGTVDLPEIKSAGKDKWDVTKPSGQDMKALVATVNGLPVVAGFLFPQISQMTFSDPKLKFSRHQSDVIQMIDGDGNIDLIHPSGMAIRIGETPDHAQPANKNADQSLAVDRNTGRKPYLRITMAGGKAQLTIAPDGQVTLTTDKGISATCGEPVHVEAPKVTLDTPLVEVPNGDVVASGVSLVSHVHGGVVPGGGNTGTPV